MEHLFEEPVEAQVPLQVAVAIVQGLDSTEKLDITPRATAPKEPSSPWLGYTEHDRYPPMRFEQYAEMRGWNTKLIWGQQLHRAHPSLMELSEAEVVRRVAAFLQSWLYLGFLESVLGFKINVSSITCKTRNGTKLCTDHLTLWLRAWMTMFHIGQVSDANVAIENAQIEYNAQIVSEWSVEMTTWEAGDQEDTDEMYKGLANVGRDICPSLTHLVFAVLSMRRVLMDRRGLQGERGDSIVACPDSIIKCREATLRQRGWCPFTLRMLHSNWGFRCLDWAVAANILYRPTEPLASQASEHADCSEESCARKMISSSDPAYRHFDCTGDCGLWKPNKDALEQMIADGLLPVITLSSQRSNPPGHRKTNHGLSLVGIEISRSSSYVAISHVWAHGLGDPKREGLPICQLRRLVCLSDEAVKGAHLPIWIDSLVVPEEDSLHSKTILQMGEIYRNSSAVIILDENLQNLSAPKDMAGYASLEPVFVKHTSLIKGKALHTPSMEELCFRIKTSAWMQRLWTYQEAALCSNPCIVLGDALFFPLKLGVPTSPTGCDRFFGFNMVNNLRYECFGEPEDFRDISQAIAWRSASLSIDEIPAIAPTLGIPLDDILPLAADERMIALLCALPSIPGGLLFHKGKRIGIKGFTWAPKTFMQRMNLEIDGLDSLAGRCLARNHTTGGGFIGDLYLVILENAVNVDQGIEVNRGYLDHDVLVHTERESLFFRVMLNAKPTTGPQPKSRESQETSITERLGQLAINDNTQAASRDRRWQTPSATEKEYDGIVIDNHDRLWARALLVKLLRKPPGLPARVQLCYKVVDSVDVKILSDRLQLATSTMQVTDFDFHAQGRLRTRTILLQ